MDFLSKVWALMHNYYGVLLNTLTDNGVIIVTTIALLIVGAAAVYGAYYTLKLLKFVGIKLAGGVAYSTSWLWFPIYAWIWRPIIRSIRNRQHRWRDRMQEWKRRRAEDAAIAEAVTDALENLEFNGRIRRKAAKRWYAKLGHAFGLPDLLPRRRKLGKALTDHLKKVAEASLARLKEEGKHLEALASSEAKIEGPTANVVAIGPAKNRLHEKFRRGQAA